MSRTDDLTAILMLLGLGYLVYKGPKVLEGLGETVTEFRTSTRPAAMYSPIWIPPETWTPIPGPAAQLRQAFKIGPRFINNGKRGELSGISSRGWLTSRDITASERLAFEAEKAGVTDF